jgi:mono/diheme cytochrome c family protein
MKAHPNGYFLFALVAVFVLIVVGAMGGPQEQAKSQKQQDTERLIYSLKGPDLFRAHCAPCHGSDGKGSGPVAPALKDSLPDLTTIAQRNGGIYPEERISKIIAGDEALMAHGSREMPIWGMIFHQVENDRDYGNVRLHNVTEYVKSLQQK